MRNSNNTLGHLAYNGKFDKGGNNRSMLEKKYFSPFYDSKNLQPHGVYTNGSGSIGGVGINVSGYGYGKKK